jgi:hypothetical protein
LKSREPLSSNLLLLENASQPLELSIAVTNMFLLVSILNK